MRQDETPELDSFRRLWNNTRGVRPARTERMAQVSRALNEHIARSRAQSVGQEGVSRESTQGKVIEVRRRHSPQASRGWVGYIAICALAVGGAFGVRQLLRPATTTHVTQQKVYTTHQGQRAKVQLADGSQVILAPATVMHVSGTAGRTIELDGEAVFTVINHMESPFTVSTGGTTTRVLGTTFGVRAYSSDKVARIVVAEGKVVTGGTVLGIGDVLYASNNSIKRIEHDTNVTRMLSWTEGRLVFDNAPMGEAALELERWYGIQIKFADSSIAHRKISGELVSQNLDEALRLVTNTIGVAVQRNGSQVTFRDRTGD